MLHGRDIEKWNLTPIRGSKSLKDLNLLYNTQIHALPFTRHGAPLHHKLGGGYLTVWSVGLYP